MPRHLSLTIALLLAVAGTVAAGPIEPVRRDGRARLAPATRGRLAPVMPVTAGRAAGLKPVTSGRLAPIMPVTRDRAARLAPATRGRAAGLSPITSGRSAGLKPVTSGRSARLSPVTSGRAAGLAPVTSGRAAGLAPVTSGRAAGLAPVTSGRAAGLAPVTSGRAAGPAPVTRGRAAALPPITVDRGGLEGLLLGGSNPPVVAFDNGYIAPYEARTLVDGGVLSESLLRLRESRRDAFLRTGVGVVHRRRGDVRRVLDTLDPYGPHRHRLRPLGQNVPPGVRVGSFYFPAAYYIRPGGARDRRRAPGARLILVARDRTEEIPEDYRRRLQKSNFPMIMGDVAFKAGDYVQAALAFQDAGDRRPRAAAAHIALADALLALRNYGYAADELRAGLMLAPTWADDLDRHGVYGKEGHLERHLAEVGETAAKNGGGADAWFLLGYLRMTSGIPAEEEKAAAAFRAALDRAPDDALAQRYLNKLSR